MPTWAKNNWQATANTKPTPQDLDDLGNSIRTWGLAGAAPNTLEVNANGQRLVNLYRLAMYVGGSGIDMNNCPLTNVGATVITGSIQHSGSSLIMDLPGSIMSSNALGVNIKYTDTWRYVNNNACAGFFGQDFEGDGIALWIAGKNVSGAGAVASPSPKFVFSTDGALLLGGLSASLTSDNQLQMSAALGGIAVTGYHMAGVGSFQVGVANSNATFGTGGFLRQTDSQAIRFFVNNTLEAVTIWPTGTVAFPKGLAVQGVDSLMAPNAPNYGLGRVDIDLGYPDINTVQLMGWSGLRLRSASYTLDIEHVNGGFVFGGGGRIVNMAKRNLLGTAGGTIASGALSVNDANITFYENSSENWAGIGVDSSGTMWFRTGFSGTPSYAIAIDTLQKTWIGGNMQITNGKFICTNPGPYDSNAAAVAAGLTSGTFYRDSNGFVRQVL